MEYIDAHHNEFDVIITDAPDPVGRHRPPLVPLFVCHCLALLTMLSPAGPAVCLFQKDYFARVKLALKPGGLMCLQGTVPPAHHMCMYVHYRTAEETCSGEAYILY